MASEIPQFIERDPEEIMTVCRDQLEAFLGRPLEDAQVEQLILQFIVYQEILLLNRFNAGMSQMLYQFSQAPILDYIAGLVAVERLPATSAGCEIRFELVKGHGDVLIPKGIRVATSDSKVVFKVTEDYPLSPEISDIDIYVFAEIPGKLGNGYSKGDVNKILDPLAFVESVTNTDETSGGSDEETDEQLRERIKLAPSQYGSAGSRQSYLFHAKSASPAIIDVSVSSPTPGQVWIVPLTDKVDVASDAYNEILDAVDYACSAENVRPLTDTVVVVAPQRKDYTIKVELKLFENFKKTESDVIAEITTALEKYAQENRKKLGMDIVRSHISKICRIDSVYDVKVVEPEDNMVIGEGEFAFCEDKDIDVKVTEYNHG
jgi:phage-related baseplate assembly protein